MSNNVFHDTNFRWCTKNLGKFFYFHAVLKNVWKKIVFRGTNFLGFSQQMWKTRKLIPVKISTTKLHLERACFTRRNCLVPAVFGHCGKTKFLNSRFRQIFHCYNRAPYYVCNVLGKSTFSVHNRTTAWWSANIHQVFFISKNLITEIFYKD